jgi:2Fe-2S ferredoxin
VSLDQTTKTRKSFFVHENVTVRVSFIPLGVNAFAKPNETVLDVARRAGAPIGNSCGATGICARCRIRVVDGAEQLSPMTSIELRTLTRVGFQAEERLACQCAVRGDCSVTTSYW